MIVETKIVQIFKENNGGAPYRDWERGLRDGTFRARVQARIASLRLGNLGKHKSVGGGVTELILEFGPGFRIYIGQVGSKVVILLCGGDKSTQTKDIKLAKEYWADYQTRAKEASK